jgi:hypothetical protein
MRMNVGCTIYRSGGFILELQAWKAVRYSEFRYTFLNSFVVIFYFTVQYYHFLPVLEMEIQKCRYTR